MVNSGGMILFVIVNVCEEFWVIEESVGVGYWLKKKCWWKEEEDLLCWNDKMKKRFRWFAQWIELSFFVWLNCLKFVKWSVKKVFFNWYLIWILNESEMKEKHWWDNVLEEKTGKIISFSRRRERFIKSLIKDEIW